MTHFFVVGQNLKDLVEQLHAILSPILDAEESELVELEVRGKPGSQSLKVYIDAPGGIPLDKCERISRQFSDQLDVEDIMPGAYRLEVSSPGLTRPLQKPSDFKRNLHRVVEVFYETDEGRMTFQGELVEVTDKMIRIKSKKATKEIEFEIISMGKIALPW